MRFGWHQRKFTPLQTESNDMSSEDTETPSITHCTGKKRSLELVNVNAWRGLNIGRWYEMMTDALRVIDDLTADQSKI